MEHHDYFDTTTWHREEDGIVWSPMVANSEPNTYNEMIARLAMPVQDDWSWWTATTPAQYTYMSQSLCSTSPAYRDAEVATLQDEYCASNSLSFGMPATAQWPVQFQESSQNIPYSSNGHQATLPQRPAHAQSIDVSAMDGKTTSSAAERQLHPPLALPWPDVFASTRATYKDPPASTGDAQPQRKAKRSAEDLYTPHWVRNHGTQREGWCGWCCTWFTLRDSTYWYHMHYSHGISQADGKRLPPPAGFRTFCDSAEWEVKCGKCNKWMPLPPGDRWNTAYFRHTYKCYFKSTVRGDQSGPSSPIKPATPRRTISNVL